MWSGCALAPGNLLSCASRSCCTAATLLSISCISLSFSAVASLAAFSAWSICSSFSSRFSRSDFPRRGFFSFFLLCLEEEEDEEEAEDDQVSSLLRPYELVWCLRLCALCRSCFWELSPLSTSMRITWAGWVLWDGLHWDADQPQLLPFCWPQPIDSALDIAERNTKSSRRPAMADTLTTLGRQARRQHGPTLFWA